MLFTGIHNVGIGVSDMDKVLEFYSGLLGFKEVMSGLGETRDGTI